MGAVDRVSAPVTFHEHHSFENLRRQFFWYDHFWGDTIQDLWRQGGTGELSVVDGISGGVMRMTCDAGETAYLDWGGVYNSLLTDHEVALEVRHKKSAIDSNCFTYIGLDNDNSNRILWYNFNANGNIYSNKNASITQHSSNGTMIADTWTILRIQCHNFGGQHIHYYQDFIETGDSPISTNIPDLHLQPWIYGYRSVAGGDTQTFDWDYVGVRM